MKVRACCLLLGVFLFWLPLKVSSADEVGNKIFPPLAADERINARLEVIKNEKNYTLHVFFVNQLGQQKECLTKKRVQSFIIRNDARYIFYRVANDEGNWPGVYFFNGTSGEIIFIGNFPNYDISADGNTMFTYIPRTEDQTVGVGILYDVLAMHEIERYDFQKELINKYGKSAGIGFFALGIYFNDKLGGFEILFDQFEELGKLSCTGIITLKDEAFHFTDRKKELLKIMGY